MSLLKNIGIINSHLLFDILMNPEIGNTNIFKQIIVLFDDNFSKISDLLSNNCKFEKKNSDLILKKFINILDNDVIMQKLFTNDCEYLLDKDDVLIHLHIDHHAITVFIEKNTNSYDVSVMNGGKGINFVLDKMNITDSGIVSQCIFKLENIERAKMKNMYYFLSQTKKLNISVFYYVIKYYFTYPSLFVNNVTSLYIELLGEFCKNNKAVIPNPKMEQDIKTEVIVKKYNYYIQNIGNCTLLSTMLVLYYLCLKENNFEMDLKINNFEMDLKKSPENKSEKMFDVFKKFINDLNKQIISKEVEKKLVQYSKSDESYILSDKSDELNILSDETDLYIVCKILKKKYNSNTDINDNLFLSILKNNINIQLSVSDDLLIDKHINNIFDIDKSIQIIKLSQIQNYKEKITNIIDKNNNIPQITSKNYSELSSKTIVEMSKNVYIEIRNIANVNTFLYGDYDIININNIIKSCFNDKKLILILKINDNIQNIIKMMNENNVLEYWKFILLILSTKNKNNIINNVIVCIVIKTLIEIFNTLKKHYAITTKHGDLYTKNMLINLFDKYEQINSNTEHFDVNSIDDNFFVDINEKNITVSDIYDSDDKNATKTTVFIKNTYLVLIDNIMRDMTDEEKTKIITIEIMQHSGKYIESKRTIMLSYFMYLTGEIKKNMKILNINTCNDCDIFENYIGFKIFEMIRKKTNKNNPDEKNKAQKLYSMLYELMYTIVINETIEYNKCNEKNKSTHVLLKNTYVNFHGIISNSKYEYMPHIYDIYNSVKNNTKTWKNKKIWPQFKKLLLPTKCHETITDINNFDMIETNIKENVNHFDFLKNIDVFIKNDIENLNIELFLIMMFGFVYIMEINKYGYDKNIKINMMTILKQKIKNCVFDKNIEYINYIYLLYLDDIISKTNSNYAVILYLENKIKSFKKTFENELYYLYKDNITLLKRILFTNSKIMFIDKQIEIKTTYKNNYSFVNIDDRIYFLNLNESKIYTTTIDNDVEYYGNIEFKDIYNEYKIKSFTIKPYINKTEIAIIVANFDNIPMCHYHAFIGQLMQSKLQRLHCDIMVPLFLCNYIFYKINNINEMYDIYIGITNKNDLSNIIIINPSYNNYDVAIYKNANYDKIFDVNLINEYGIYVYNYNFDLVYLTTYQFIDYCDKNKKNKILNFVAKIILHMDNNSIMISYDFKKKTFNVKILGHGKIFEINFETQQIIYDDCHVIDNNDIYIENNEKIYKWLVGIKSVFLLKKNNKYMILNMNKITNDQLYELKQDVIFTSFKENNVYLVRKLMKLISQNIYTLTLSDNYEYISGSLNAMITYLFFAFYYGNTFVIKKIISVINSSLYNEKIDKNNQLLLCSIIYISFPLYIDGFYMFSVRKKLASLFNIVKISTYETNEMIDNSVISIENFNIVNKIFVTSKNNTITDSSFVDEFSDVKSYNNLQSYLCDKINKNNFVFRCLIHELAIANNDIYVRLEDVLCQSINHNNSLEIFIDLYDKKYFHIGSSNSALLYANSGFIKYDKKMNLKITPANIVNYDDNDIKKKLPNINQLINNTIAAYLKKGYILDEIYNCDNYKKTYCNYLIMYQYMFNSLIKKKQYMLISEMYDNITSNNMYIKHIMMGEGKSSYLVPLLILKLTKKYNHIIIIVPEYLLLQTFNFLILAKYTYDKLNKYNKMNLEILNNDNYHRINYIFANKELYDKNVIITTMHILKTIILRNNNLHEIIKNNPIIIDEADELLDNTKNELNIEYDNTIVGMSKTEKDLKPIILEIVNKCIFDIDKSWNAKILQNNLNQQIIVDSDIINKLTKHLENKFVDKKDLLDNYKNYFIYTLIPAICSNIHNRHFGLNISKFNTFRLAVPYLGEYKPSNSNVYDDILLTIALSYISFKLASNNNINELSKIYLKKIKSKLDKYKDNVIINNIVNDNVNNMFGKSFIDIDIEKLDISKLNINKDNLIMVLFNDACDNDISRCSYIKNISSVDVLQNYFTTKKIGLTGTPNEIIDIDMLDNGFFYNNMNTELYKLYEKNIKDVHNIINMNLSLKNLCWLESIVDNGSLIYNCIIDLGSFFVNYDIDIIIEKLCSILSNVKYNGFGIKYLLYPRDGITTIISIDTGNTDLKIHYDQNMQHIFYFIPQRFTVGYDISMPDNTHALVTFNYTLITFDNFMQAIYRLRKINNGQIFSVAVPLILYNFNINVFINSIYLNKNYDDELQKHILADYSKYNNVLDIVNYESSFKKMCWINNIINNNNICLIDLSNLIIHDISDINNYFDNFKDKKYFINNVNFDININNTNSNIFIYLSKYILNNINEIINFINKLDNVDIYITVTNSNLSVSNMNVMHDLFTQFSHLMLKKYKIITTYDNKKITKDNLLKKLIDNTHNKNSIKKSIYSIQIANVYLRQKKLIK